MGVKNSLVDFSVKKKIDKESINSFWFSLCKVIVRF